ncbi:MAG TPA: glycosyltransferase family A protein [Bryobacteraceae bacterium]
MPSVILAELGLGLRPIAYILVPYLRFSVAETQSSPTPPQLSVIIPIHASEHEAVGSLALVLRSLKASLFQNFEVIVADDGSLMGDEVRAVVREAGAKSLRLNRRGGPAAAINAAAAEAKAGILVFLDAESSPRPDTLDRFARKFDGDRDLDAVAGSYDQNPARPGLISRFHNLLHSFVRQRTSTFWAGCGAVRRARFQALGGFDENLPKPSADDVEFGIRLCEVGGRIDFDREIQVTSHRAWSLPSMVQTDFVERAASAALGRRFKISGSISATLTVSTLPLIVLALLHGGPWRLLPPISLAAIALLNRPLLRFLALAGNWHETLLCFPLLLVYFASCAAGALGGLALAAHRRDRFFWPSVAGVALALLAIQIASGAYQAEFTGYPDEPAHFVSGLMVYDYLTTLPRGSPIAWAGQYYLHYPKVAIGHWPPGYYALEAVWWLFLGPSRTTSMLLQWAIGVAALTALYRLSRASLSFPITAVILACTIATPVFQQSLDQTMADLCCLLWSVLLMLALVRLLEQQDRTAAVWVAIWLVAAAMTKGTVVCLLPVPVLALLATRPRIRVPLRWVAVAAVIVLMPAAWYLWIGGIKAWGGMYATVPWSGALAGNLAGWGCVVLAVLGLQQKPLAIVAESVMISTLGVSFVVRAVHEERHWIIALPAILLLAGMGISRFRSPLAVGALAAMAAMLFPFSWYRESSTGYADLVRQLHRPARMLVSSTSIGEGPWIAETSLAEKRPSSFVVRASKVLAEEGWSGEGYRLLTGSRDAVLQRLDELALDTVILDSAPNPFPPPHHALLTDAMRDNPGWQPCGSFRYLIAYCRVRPPEFPRQPLHLNIYGWNFEEDIRP